MRGEMRAVLLGGIFSLPFRPGLALAYDRLLYGLPGFDFLSVTGAFVVWCSVGWRPASFRRWGLWRRRLPNC